MSCLSYQTLKWNCSENGEREGAEGAKRRFSAGAIRLTEFELHIKMISSAQVHVQCILSGCCVEFEICIACAASHPSPAALSPSPAAP